MMNVKYIKVTLGLALILEVFGTAGCAKSIGDSLSDGLNAAFPTSHPSPMPDGPKISKQITLTVPASADTPVWIRADLTPADKRHIVREKRQDLAVTVTVLGQTTSDVDAGIKELENIKCDQEVGKTVCDYRTFSGYVTDVTLFIPESGVPTSYFQLTPLSFDSVYTEDLSLLLLGDTDPALDPDKFALIKKWVNPTAFLTLSDLSQITDGMTDDDARLEMIRELGPYVTDGSDDKIQKQYFYFISDSKRAAAIELLKQVVPKHP